MAASPRKNKPAATAHVEASAPEMTLEIVRQATEAGNIVYTSAEFHNPLIESGDVEINSGMIDEHGNIATRAIFKETPMIETTEINVTEKPKFEIESDVVIPDRVRKVSGNRAGRTPVYPFDALEVGQAFHVADKSADKPAAKAMASTVAGANARYAEVVEGEFRTNRKGVSVPVTKQLRQFKVFEATKTMLDGSVVPGAYIKRML